MRWILALAFTACGPYYAQGLVNPPPTSDVPWTFVRRIAHDDDSFTEGLVFHDGILYESSGGGGTSRLIKTRASDGRVVEERAWPNGIEGSGLVPFAEGLALVDRTLVQLSWKNERALTWNLDDLTRGDDLGYAGEGWGLCFDGATLWRSDGSSKLRPHGRDMREHRGAAIEVTLNGARVRQLNELECIDGNIFANVWQTPYVLIIRPEDGVVTGVLDLNRIVDAEDASGRESVLNGLAWDPRRRELYVSGKNWSHTYVVRLDGSRR